MNTQTSTQTDSNGILAESIGLLSETLVGAMGRTLWAYAFNGRKLVDAILTKQWGGLAKPIKYNLTALGTLFAMLTVMGGLELDEIDGKVLKYLTPILPYFALFVFSIPYWLLFHVFLARPHRKAADTLRIMCYANGTAMIVCAAVAPVSLLGDMLSTVLAPFMIYLLLVRPFQILRISHGVGVWQVLVAGMLANMTIFLAFFVVVGTVSRWIK